MNQGKIIALNKDVVKDINVLKNHFGYCPQNNALFENLTVGEMVDFYRRLKPTQVLKFSYLFF